MNHFIRILLVLLTALGPQYTWAVSKTLDADFLQNGSKAERNYILNGEYERNVNGTVAYADAAGARPVDATGGSPTLTCTRTTSSPLDGDGSLLITKDAANRQGNGCSVAFTTKAISNASVLQIEFSYTIPSGTYADGDLVVDVYDATGASVASTQPAPTQILNTGVVQKWSGSFQVPSGSTSFRLAFHVASTSASAYTVKIDSLRVGPQRSSIGPSMADGKSVTVTPSAGFGTTSLQSTFMYRTGDRARFVGYYKGGTVAASTMSIALPSGYVIDSTKLTSATSAQHVGFWHQIRTGGSGGAGPYPAFYDGSDTANIYLAANSASNVFTKVNASSVVSTSDGVSFEFEVPIAGWSSNTIQSPDAETRVVSAKFYKSASVSTTAGTQINFDSLLKDTHSAVTTGAGAWKFTAPSPGEYQIESYLTASSAGYVEIYKNGSVFGPFGYISVDGVLSSSATVSLVAGDYIDLRPSGTTTISGNATVSNTNAGFISIFKLSGHAQVQASEKVAASIGLTSAVTPSTNAVVKYDTVIQDTHSGYSASTGLYTAPSPGTYVFKVNALTGTTANFYVKVNGTAKGVFMTALAGAVYSGSFDYPLLAGDTVGVYIDTSGTLTAVSGSVGYYNRLSIHRLGSN